jgi:hypothetical protein
MSNNNYPDPTRNNPPQSSGWNTPNQPTGQGYFVPPTTVTGYDAKYPLGDPQVSAMPSEVAYRQAERRVNAKLRFYKHLTSYLVVNAFLWVIALVSWVSSGSGSIWTLIWPIWVTIFWGIGLASDYVQTFGLNDNTRQRMIEEEMKRIRR